MSAMLHGPAHAVVDILKTDLCGPSLILIAESFGSLRQRGEVLRGTDSFQVCFL